MNNPSLPPSNTPVVAPWAYMIGSIIYLFFPFDLIPDVPIIGHIDDVLILLISTLNLAQAYLARIDSSLAMIAKTLKIVAILLAVVVIGILAIAGTAIYQILG